MHNNLGLYRFCAKLIDIIGFILVAIGINIIVTMMLTIGINEFILYLISGLIFLVLFVVWFVLLPAMFGWSPGKLILGLRIKPKLNFIQSLCREPFLYVIIPVILASIMYPYNMVLSSYILLFATIIAGLLAVMFYFKKDIWNKFGKVSVVEKGA